MLPRTRRSQLKRIPFFDDNEVAALVAELPTYRALVIGEDVGGNVDCEAWWDGKAAATGVGRWYAGATMVMICQPSSAAAERVFSMLKAIVGDQQCKRTRSKKPKRPVSWSDITR